MATAGRRYLQQRVLKRRNARRFKEREDLFETMDDEEFRENFRLTKEAALDLVERFKQSPYSNKTKRSYALSPKLQVIYVSFHYFIVIEGVRFLPSAGEGSGKNFDTGRAISLPPFPPDKVLFLHRPGIISPLSVKSTH